MDSMLEYLKVILQKVSFDRVLFEKELIKGLKILKKDELLQLEQWCYESFSGLHLLIVTRVFQTQLPATECR